MSSELSSAVKMFSEFLNGNRDELLISQINDLFEESGLEERIQPKEMTCVNTGNFGFGYGDEDESENRICQLTYHSQSELKAMIDTINCFNLETEVFETKEEYETWLHNKEE